MIEVDLVVIRETVSIIVGVFIATLGNVFYKVNIKENILPLWLRALNGALAFSVFLAFIWAHQNGDFGMSPAKMFVSFAIGVVIEPFHKWFFVRFPEILTKLAEKKLDIDLKDDDDKGGDDVEEKKN